MTDAIITDTIIIIMNDYYYLLIPHKGSFSFKALMVHNAFLHLLKKPTFF
jgi:hypothetical protein